MLLSVQFGCGRGAFVTTSKQRKGVWVVNVFGPLTTPDNVGRLGLAIEHVLRSNPVRERPLRIQVDPTRLTDLSEVGVKGLRFFRSLVARDNRNNTLSLVRATRRTRNVLCNQIRHALEDQLPTCSVVEEGALYLV